MKHLEASRVVLSLAAAFVVVACSAAVPDEPIATNEAAINTAPSSSSTPPPPPDANRCDARDSCTATPSGFAPSSSFEQALQALGCSPPQAYWNPLQRLPGRKVSRCADTVDVRHAVRDAADYYKARITQHTCGTCLPRLQDGEIYVFWTSLAIAPNCPNNCGLDSEGNPDTSGN